MENKEIEQVLPKEDDFTNQLMKLKLGNIDEAESFVTSKDVENLEEEFKEITCNGLDSQISDKDSYGFIDIEKEKQRLRRLK